MLQSNRKMRGKPGAKGARDGGTRSFVPETLRISGTTAPVGHAVTAPGIGDALLPSVATPARATPLPRPALDVSNTPERAPASLGLEAPDPSRTALATSPPPSHAEGEPAPRLDATLDVNDSELSIVDAYTRSDPPPLPGLRAKARKPWVVWSAAGTALCALGAFACFAASHQAVSPLRAVGVATATRASVPAATVSDDAQRAQPSMPAVASPSAVAAETTPRGAADVPAAANAEAVAPGMPAPLAATKPPVSSELKTAHERATKRSTRTAKRAVRKPAKTALSKPLKGRDRQRTERTTKAPARS